MFEYLCVLPKRKWARYFVDKLTSEAQICLKLRYFLKQKCFIFKHQMIFLRIIKRQVSKIKQRCLKFTLKNSKDVYINTRCSKFTLKMSNNV